MRNPGENENGKGKMRNVWSSNKDQRPRSVKKQAQSACSLFMSWCTWESSIFLLEKNEFWCQLWYLWKVL